MIDNFGTVWRQLCNTWWDGFHIFLENIKLQYGAMNHITLSIQVYAVIT
jgi:hypothetical protein